MIQVCCDKLLAFHLLLISFHLMSVVKCGSNEILTLTANERGKVEIQCPYESRYEENVKYLCKGEYKILNKDIPVSSGSTANDKRFSLIDNSTTHIFTVTITDLRPEDEHTYWCGVKTGFGHFDDNTKILLKIKQGSLTTMTAMSTKTQTVSIYSNQPGSTHYTVITLAMSSSSSSSSSPHSHSVSVKVKSDFIVVIIMLSVTVILLVFGLSLFVSYRHRQKSKDRESSLIGSDKLQENAENNVYIICGYEGPQDGKNHPESLPTNPSETERSVYAMPQLSTNSSETDRTIYSVAHLPTNTSAAECSVYAVVQLPKVRKKYPGHDVKPDLSSKT
ncbi:CMRF35-like molecule 5 [Myxocyprinus asiaticus]|uniref:CMRF35-like molecule 5 n=1 Tax=Myxocyprinus asiaticus TaxID=70543 RepID=UPI002221B7C9|nr:CMRF35-like molecule 5 [Myxocyprinus asiaticus]